MARRAGHEARRPEGTSRGGRRSWAGCLALASAALASCATVDAGHAAVVTSATRGVRPQPLGEGVTWVGPLAQVDTFDLRAQERTEDLIGIASDGAPVQANASIVTWHLIRDELVAFDREVGPDPYPRIIRPVVQWAVRQVVARFTAYDLIDSRNRPRIQREITELAARELRPLHVQLDEVFVRQLAVPSGPFQQQVLATGRLEQEVLALPHELELARGRADVRRDQARATAAAHALVAPTLTPPTLADAARRAWSDLLTSPSTQVEVVPDGSPVEIVP